MVTKYQGGQQIVDYLFDVTQTNGKALQRPVWTIQDEEREFIHSALSHSDSRVETLEESIDALAKRTAAGIYLNVEDHCEDAFNNFIGVEKDKRFKAFYELAVNSTQFAIREKCGLEPLPSQDLSYIKEVNDLSKINILGYITNTSTQDAMSEIAKLKKQYNLERDVSNDKLRIERGRKPLSEHTIEQQRTSAPGVREVRETSDVISSRKVSDSVSGVTNERDLNGHAASNGQRSERQHNQSNARTGDEKPRTEDRRTHGSSAIQESMVIFHTHEGRIYIHF
ncbi:hypothetical protein J2S17_002856 [Cytobacillus purgationiresistens]|uniref:Uncharacterized protein n=1 Tax=Cytobacillus purgationiresistens TaxID=863449 RepID=A0ABU0AI92_9BACI|nr:hypothetical protein [Cytobacillus purgationiresistens]MDQ0270970.1 hypothetical protein [Cytobacillus purgationiresistens]